MSLIRKNTGLKLVLIAIVFISAGFFSSESQAKFSVAKVEACPYSASKTHTSGIRFTITTYKSYQAVFVDEQRAVSLSGRYKPYGIFWGFKKSAKNPFKKIGSRGYLNIRVSGFDGETRIFWAEYKITRCRF